MERGSGCARGEDGRGRSTIAGGLGGGRGVGLGRGGGCAEGARARMVASIEIVDGVACGHVYNLAVAGTVLPGNALVTFKAANQLK
jgi:hypothetical protein